MTRTWELRPVLGNLDPYSGTLKQTRTRLCTQVPEYGRQKKTPRDLRGDLWGNLRGDLIAFGLVKKNVVYPNLNNLRLLSLFRHTHVVVPTTFNSNSLATHSCYCVFEHGGNRVITLEEFYDLKQIAANVVYHFQLYFHSPSLTL